jgi:hypothetical protein
MEDLPQDPSVKDGSESTSEVPATAEPPATAEVPATLPEESTQGPQDSPASEAARVATAAAETIEAAPEAAPETGSTGAASEAIPAEGDQSAAEDAATRAAAQRTADETVIAASRRQTRRAFVIAAAGAAAGYGFYHWLANSPEVEMQPELLRRAFRTNAALARGVTGDRALAPTYRLKDARDLRVNGVYGLKQALVPESWRLQLVGGQAGAGHPRYAADVTAWEYRYSDAASGESQGHDTKVDPNARTAEKMAPAAMMQQAKAREERMPRGREEAGESRSTLLTLDDVAALPRHELVTQFKCIEGWSQVVHWAGVRMADLLEAYPPQLVDGKEPRYVYMETPDGDYYTGYDMEVCRHPQTLLVTEMMGAPLTQFHGAPLRLHMPTKYGYKQIKRIALIAYTNDKPDDYWTRLGYDWYAGL